MPNRTKTYLAGDWTGDKDLIDMLYRRNESDFWKLSFVDAHEYTQANDNSLPCSIKKSLAERLDISKTFVLIVGKNTKNLTRGSCYNCSSYSSNSGCKNGWSISSKSFIEYECDKAVKDKLKIVVIYNYAQVDKDKCLDAVKNIGTHINGYYTADDGKCYWNYSKIKEAIMN